MALTLSVACSAVAQEAASPLAWRQGSLLLCGGGKLPSDLLDRFHELGGREKGRLVLIPTASPRSDQGDYTPWLPLWQEFPWSAVQVIHIQDRCDADHPSHAEVLQRATAVWIGGGEQSRLSQRIVDTQIEQELKHLLDRGGVLGGTSAGAAICSRVMIREGRSEPVMGTGLSILNQLIIDQHFSARRRQERLTRALSMHPGLAGLGIDERTGLLFRNESVEVLGEGEVHWYRAGDLEPEENYRADAKWDSGTRVPWSEVVRRP